METNKIREYILVKDNFSHAKLEEIGCYNYCGELKYTDDIYNMLTETFKMDRLITEVSYVIAFDYDKNPKGICKIGQGGLGETPTPMQPLFTFLMLTGASSFVVTHNHISNMPKASEHDKTATGTMAMLAIAFDMEFIGHMIINPCGYVIDGGTMDGIVAELDEDGDIYSWNSKKKENEEKEEMQFDESKAIHVTSENVHEVAEMLRKRAKGR